MCQQQQPKNPSKITKNNNSNMGQHRASLNSKNPEKDSLLEEEEEFEKSAVNSLEVSTSSSIAAGTILASTSQPLNSASKQALPLVSNEEDSKKKEKCHVEKPRGKNESTSSLETEKTSVKQETVQSTTEIFVNNLIETTLTTDLDVSQVSSQKSYSSKKSQNSKKSSRSRNEKRSRGRVSDRSSSSRRPHSTTSSSSKNNNNPRLRDLPENKSDKDYYTIILHKGVNGYGLNITGGVDQPYLPNDNGIFITKIKRKGAASQQGQLAKGDKIISMNGHSLQGITHMKALELFQKAGEKAEIVFLPHAEQLLRQQNIQKEKDHGLFWDVRTERGRSKFLRFIFWTTIFPVGSYFTLRRMGIIDRRCRLLVPLKTVPGIIAATSVSDFSSIKDYVRVRFMTALQKFRNL